MRRAPTTNMIIAKRGMRWSLAADAGEWATEQLAQGRDTPHLRQLAGTTGVENGFELDELFDRVAREMGLVVPSPEEAVAAYARERVRDFVDQRVTRQQLLHELCHLCISTDYKTAIYPFYLLRWAQDDLEEKGFSPHRWDVTHENFDALLKAEIDILLASEHQKA